jgi:hypothetical protein
MAKTAMLRLASRNLAAVWRNGEAGEISVIRGLLGQPKSEAAAEGESLVIGLGLVVLDYTGRPE